MDEVEIKLPKLGESIVSATIVKWFKKVGDFVKLDEPLLEVSTDKVNSEIPSPVTGKLTKIMAQVDEELEVGAPLARIATTEGALTQEVQAPVVAAECPVAMRTKKGFYTPVVLKIAREEGIDLTELENIPATGAGGRLSKRDLENYLQNRVTLSSSQEEERIKMTPIRKKIAEAMSRSFYEAPHATLINEIDVTNIMKHLNKTKESFQRENGFKLTITSYIAKAIADGAKKFPLVNASLDKDTIIVKKSVNLGIAVSVDQGILVPVINHCNRLSLQEIAREVASLSDKARSHSLTPSQVQEGTITLTNFGMGGALIGTPIIRYPEVAIIGMGAITKRVVPLEEDTFAIRSMMYLSLSFDHRVIDGMYGCGFLAEVKHLLERH